MDCRAASTIAGFGRFTARSSVARLIPFQCMRHSYARRMEVVVARVQPSDHSRLSEVNDSGAGLKPNPFQQFDSSIFLGESTFGDRASRKMHMQAGAFRASCTLLLLKT